MGRETESAFFRPSERRLVSLSNEELGVLFQLRASKVFAKIDPKGFWDDIRVIYWGTMMSVLMELYEVMLEIQARYPKSEIYNRERPKSGGDYFYKLLPIAELEWLEVAQREFGRQYGLKELK